MSKQIDLNQKLSEADREYLLARGRRHLVLQNDRRFAESSPAPQETNEADAEWAAQETNEADAEWAAQVNELTVAELRDELNNRGLDTKGNQETLRKRLIEAGPEV